MKKTKYIAYGSNLNLSQMAWRCPTAQVVGSAVLKGYRLTFRGVATLEKDPTAEVPVAVWAIEPRDEAALDRYEGYPYLYRKEVIGITVRGKRMRAMVYLMNAGQPAMPSAGYFNTIAEGYDEVGLDAKYLEEALADTKSRINKPKEAGNGQA
jgi:gamma-glutamylcyclotransferase (GGCT)/AIG2-like uncharacterized protein YtfP